MDFCLSTCFQELIIYHGLVSWPWIQHADLMISEPLFTYAPCLRQARPVNVPHKSQDFPQTKDFSRFPEQKLASSEKVAVHQPSATPWTSCRLLELWGFSAVPWCLTVPADALMPAHFWNDDSASLWRRRRSVVLKPSQQLDGSREACDDSVRFSFSQVENSQKEFLCMRGHFRAAWVPFEVTLLKLEVAVTSADSHTL